MTHQVALKYTQGRISPGHQHILAFCDDVYAIVYNAPTFAKSKIIFH